MKRTSNSQLQRVCLAAGAIGLVIAFFFLLWRGPLPFEGLVQRFAQMDNSGAGTSLAFQPALLRKYYKLTLVVGFALASVTTLLALAWSRLNWSAQVMAWRATCTLACTCALCLYLFKMTFDGPWAPVDVIMLNPSALPIVLVTAFYSSGWRRLSTQPYPRFPHCDASMLRR